MRIIISASSTYLRKTSRGNRENSAGAPANHHDHDAFGYFGTAYGFRFIAPEGVSTETEASARDVAKIIRQIKAQKIPAVFLENVTDPRLVRSIAAESGAKIGGTLYSDALSSQTARPAAISR